MSGATFVTKSAVFIACLQISLSVTAADELLWLGEVTTSQGIRINDATFQVIRQALDIDVSELNTNTARALKILEDSQALACRGNLRRSARRDARFSVTTVPQVVFPSVKLFSNRPLSTSPVSLTYLQQQKLVLPLQHQRDYGVNTDKLKGGALTLVDFFSYAKAGSAIAMFDRGRSDLLIEYPSVYKALSDRAEGTPYYMYDIEEAPPYSLGFIYCTNSEAGRNMTTKLDVILRELSQQQRYFEVHRDWFMHFDIDIAPLYNTAYGTQFTQ